MAARKVSKVGSHHQIRRKAEVMALVMAPATAPAHQSFSHANKVARPRAGFRQDLRQTGCGGLHFKCSRASPSQPFFSFFSFCSLCAVLVAVQRACSLLWWWPAVAPLSPKSRRYSSDLLAAASMWERCSPALYSQILQDGLLSLPSISCLKRLAKDLRTGAGMSASTKTYLKARIKTLTLLCK